VSGFLRQGSKDVTVSLEKEDQIRVEERIERIENSVQQI